MKNKKIVLAIIIITIILMCIPTNAFAWLQYTTYEACNIINLGISGLLKTIAFIIAIGYVKGIIKYIQFSKVEKKQKVKNILTSLVMVIVEITFFWAASLWVKEIGMETYWSSGERYQFREIDGFISNGIRITALISIVAYIITTISYFIKSKQENIRKLENVIRGQIITSTIVAGLLVFARNW